MLPRRLYSALTTRAAVSDAGAATKPRASTRGRARPVRATLKRKETVPAPTPSCSTAPTHGRRLRRGVLSRTDLVSTEPRFGFEPIALYPLQAGLHMGLTPAHMPLPLALGTKGYTSPLSSSSAPLFQRPAPRSALSALDALPSGSSALGEHLRVSRAFSHPALSHHLASDAAPLSIFDVHGDAHVTATLDSAAGKHARAAEDSWEATLARLGHRAAPPSSGQTAAAKAKLDDALAGLNGLLARLETTDIEDVVVDHVVSMDSVKRKRKKKMNKHKYKKRRKETRALRKRLGK